jgi:hypothetical protein
MPIDTPILSPFPILPCLAGFKVTVSEPRALPRSLPSSRRRRSPSSSAPPPPECLLSCQCPLALTAFASPIGSVDGLTLQIDELKGTKPTEKINLSHKNLGVASAIIIASCIKGNGVLKELECATPPQSICFLVRAR